jgi:tripartite-type tricarboxylate transporter receptor subunit TctC
MKRASLLFLLVFVCGPGFAWAQSWPSRPVRVIIAFPPGSAVDIVGRLYANRLSEIWGQTAVADNRAGAGGSIAAGIAARSAPDGYTVLLHSSGHAVNPSIYAKLPYDPLKSFVEIGPLAQQPNVLVVNATSPYRTVADLIKSARARPGQVTIASAGVGSGTHLNLEKFKFDGKLDVNHVPYKGSSEALVDVMGGRVDGFFAPISAGIEHIRSGKVRALGASTVKRSSRCPTCRRSPRPRCPGSSPRCGSGCGHRPARRRRWWIASRPTCGAPVSTCAQLAWATSRWRSVAKFVREEIDPRWLGPLLGSWFFAIKVKDRRR